MERPRQCLRPLRPELHTVRFNRRKRRLRNPGALGELILTELIELARNAHRLTNGQLPTHLGSRIPPTTALLLFFGAAWLLFLLNLPTKKTVRTWTGRRSS